MRSSTGLSVFDGERGPRVEDDRVHLHRPDRGCDLGQDELRMPAPAVVGDGLRLDECGRALGRVLRVEPFAVDSLGEPLERHRPIAVRRDERARDREEILRELALGDPELGPEHAVRARQPDLAVSVRSGDGQGDALRRHAQTLWRHATSVTPQRAERSDLVPQLRLNPAHAVRNRSRRQGPPEPAELEHAHRAGLTAGPGSGGASRGSRG